MRSWLSCALVLPVLWSCQRGSAVPSATPGDPTAGAVSFSWAGPGEEAIVVPVYVNGVGPYEFILDTAASTTCVSREVAEDLALPTARGQIAFASGIGGSGRVPVVQIDSLRVGTVEGRDLVACAVDLRGPGPAAPNLDGFLGLNFLRPLRMVLDFGRQTLVLQAP